MSLLLLTSCYLFSSSQIDTTCEDLGACRPPGKDSGGKDSAPGEVLVLGTPIAVAYTHPCEDNMRCLVPAIVEADGVESSCEPQLLTQAAWPTEPTAIDARTSANPVQLWVVGGSAAAFCQPNDTNKDTQVFDLGLSVQQTDVALVGPRNYVVVDGAVHETDLKEGLTTIAQPSGKLGAEEVSTLTVSNGTLYAATVRDGSKTPIATSIQSFDGSAWTVVEDGVFNGAGPITGGFFRLGDVTIGCNFLGSVTTSGETPSSIGALDVEAFPEANVVDCAWDPVEEQILMVSSSYGVIAVTPGASQVVWTPSVDDWELVGGTPLDR